jgi:hypothetical protein
MTKKKFAPLAARAVYICPIFLLLTLKAVNFTPTQELKIIILHIFS